MFRCTVSYPDGATRSATFGTYQHALDFARNNVPKGGAYSITVYLDFKATAPSEPRTFDLNGAGATSISYSTDTQVSGHAPVSEADIHRRIARAEAVADAARLVLANLRQILADASGVTPLR